MPPEKKAIKLTLKSGKNYVLVKETPTVRKENLEESFNFDLLFQDAESFFAVEAKTKDIHYPRGSSLSRRSPIIKELFNKQKITH